jgi:hypothetical protein
MSSVAIPPTIPGDSEFSSVQVNSFLKVMGEIIGPAVSKLNTWKGTVRVATTANITLSGAQTIDGIAAVAGDRVLVKNQGTGSENGIYVVKPLAWVRADDMAEDSSASGAAVFVSVGTTNAEKIYVCTNDIGSDIVGTDALVFETISATALAAGSNTQVQYNSSGDLAGSANLTFNGTNLTCAGLVTGGTGLTATTGAITATAGNVVVSTATNGVNLTKITVAASGAIESNPTATITARQGYITVAASNLAGDAIGTMTVTATGLTTTTSLVFAQIMARSATDGGLVLQVTSVAANTFTIVVKNADDATAATGTFTIGYVIF